MKKLLFSILLLVFTLPNLSAQAEFGVKSGYFDSTLVNTDTRDGRRYDGIYVGAFSEFPISERFSIIPEVNYMRTLGSRSESGLYDFMDQLQIPVLANYKIGKKFNLFAGPNMMFLLTKHEEFNTFSLGIKYGLSYDITQKLSIEVTLNNGFQNVIKSETNDLNFNKARFRGIQIGLNYKF